MGNFGKEFMGAISDGLNDGADYLNEVVYQQVEMALSNEKRHEIRRVITVLYAELNIEDKTIIRLLKDYWSMSESEAKEAIRYEKTIKHPIRVLKNYLEEQGYTHLGAISFIKENNIIEKLQNDSSLWKLSENPEKFLKKITNDSI